MTHIIDSSFPVAPVRRFTLNLTDGPFGSALTSSHYSDEGARVIRLGNIGSAEFRDSDKAYIPLDYFERLLRHEVVAGDLIIAGLGDGNHPVGRACIAPEGLGPAIVKADCFRARLDENRLLHRYAAWALSSSAISQQILTLTRGTTRSRINLDILREIEVPVPALEEQRRIAAFLDAATARIDALTRARDSQLRCLEELWQSRLADKTEDLIAAHGLLPLRRVVISVEQGWSPQCEDVEASPSEWAVLKTSAVSTGTFRSLQHKRLPNDLQPELRYQINDGDILMTRGSGSPAHVGVAALAKTDGRRLLLSDLLYRVRVSDGWSPEFVTLLLGSKPVRGLMALLLRGQSGQTIKLRAEDIKSIGVPAAPTEIQPQIANELEDMRRRVREAQHVLRRSQALLAERRQALITAAVTGQFDVSTASGRNVTDGVPA